MKYCCLLDDDYSIIKVFNSYFQMVREYNIINASCVKSPCEGDCDKYKNYRIRHYDEVSKTYIPTRFDNGTAKSKGMYKRLIYCAINDKTYKNQTECSQDLGIAQSLVSKILREVCEDRYKLSYMS